MDTQIEYAYQNIIEQIFNDDELKEIVEIDKEKAKVIIDEAVAEYKDTNPGDDDIRTSLQSYCEDFISSDDFQKAKIDQAAFVYLT